MANLSGKLSGRSSLSGSVNGKSASEAAALAREYAEEAYEASQHYPTIIEGYWYLWDVENEQFVNTNIPAQGPQGAQGEQGIQGIQGETGNGIASIRETSVTGLRHTYTITYTDGTTTTFSVLNGKGISNINKTGTSGLVDTYTITYNDSTTSTFTVTNGRGISSIAKTDTTDYVDTYTITYTDGTTSTYTVTNANEDDIDDLKAAVEKYDDLCRIIKITATNTTLGDVAATLNSVNTAGDHVFFDMSALGVMMYLCTIFIDTTNNVYKVFDLVSGRYAEGTYDSTMLLTMATAQANGLAVQSQIDRLQTEIDELGGKSVVANWDVLADMVQAGTSTDLIKAGDTIPINWIATVLGTTTNGLTVSCSDPDKFINGVGEAEAKDYLFVYDGSDWTYNGDSITLADFGLSVSGTPATGEVMNIKTTVNEKSYTFVDYDPSNVVDATVNHSWMLEQTYAPDTKAYCSYQALFAIYKGKRVPAGNYHLRCRMVSKSAWVDCYLHVTAEMGSDEYIVQARSNGYLSSQSFTNEDGVTITGAYTINTLTPNIYGTRTAAAGALTIAYAKTDGVTYTELTDLNVDPNDPVVFTSSMVFDKCTLGNNTWEQSQISEWLNDDTGAKSSVAPVWMLYVPNSYNLGAGFLYGIDPRVKKYIQTANVKWVAGYSSEYTQGQLYTTQQKVFLLSMKEMSFNLQTTEGDVTDLYDEYTGSTLTNAAVAARAKYNKAGGTLNNYRWSRSASSGNASSSRYVTSTGANSSSYALGAHYYAPAFIFGKSGIA